MDEKHRLASSSVSELSNNEDNTEIFLLSQPSHQNAVLQNILSKEITDNKSLYLIHGKDKESLKSSFAQEKEEKSLQLSNELPCCSKMGTAVDFPDKVVLGGLFIPWELYDYIGFDLLRPLAKFQALKNMNLYHAIRNELRRRGKNAGLRMLDIASEITVPGYFREIRAFWNNRSDTGENDFEFAFIRIVSFLYWANANIYSPTDLGLLNVEKLMLCYNCRWGETSTARKRFDAFIRRILFDMKDLLALRSWCGILREKTVVDVAMIRAEYLVVLDLGTMVSKGPFKKWNLKELFPKLKNLEDFTWLNCDVRTLVYLTSVNSLKRLVLHITKYDRVFFEQFFARFGFDVDVDSRESGNNEEVRQKIQSLTPQRPIYDDNNDLDSLASISASQDRTQETLSLSSSLVQSTFSDLDEEEETGSQSWISVKPATKKVYLDYAALSFAYGILRSKKYNLRNWSNKGAGFQSDFLP
uniref:F-box domain-containing protein n=1 Tax=Elaeophora elaphi TaxID=1147741 RepID=A0A0R3RMR5_9BILA